MGDLIGVFGGTFDPPHIGHCILADEACHWFDMDRVYWVPAGQPPHKPGRPISRIEDRLAMVANITSQNPCFELSRVDVDRPGPHFAVETLALLRRDQPDAEFIYLMGSDSLSDLHAWHEPHRLLQQCQAIGVMQRPGTAFDLDQLDTEIPGLHEKVRVFPAPFVDLSGYSIRQRVKAGLSVRYMLTAEVNDLIFQRKLYL
ncbi:MAG: nicotinate (nicotinamide) nucleotide adenylyltransferase [Anaerolineales bacterium]|nr:MAG: nicotinate (nicotinamide) nucleotide adenylyltransferase [Anaerolineales bacterium]